MPKVDGNRPPYAKRTGGNMKLKMRNRVLTATLLATLLISAGAFAQSKTTPQHGAKHHQYKVVDLGTFGGPSSSVNCCEHQITARGVVVGSADTSAANPNPGCFNGPLGSSDCYVNQAFQWRNGTLTNLGALPGGYNSYGQALNARGTVVGSAENGVTDPDLGIAEFEAVLWRNGQITDLGTLGGNESLAFDINDRGQIVGVAANTVPDPASFFGFATQTRPFFWENGVMRDLDTLGSTDGAAYLMNARGQAMGQFYVNGGTAVDPIFWDEDGNAVDIGTLGGTNGNPFGLNNRGQVVGDSNLAGDAAHHGFLWDRGTLTDLGTLGGNQSIARWISDSGVITGNGDVPGSQTHHGTRWAWKHGVMTVTDLGVINNDPCSTGFAVNNSGQIVGDAGACGIGGDAWLWENGGPMVDLNTLTLPGSGLHLADARLINDRGEIVCTGVLSNGDKHAVLLIPVDGDDSANWGAAATPSLSPLYVPREGRHSAQPQWGKR
jgi:probable HAF family extracellular repeat protein